MPTNDGAVHGKWFESWTRGLGTFPGNVQAPVTVQLGVLCEQRRAKPSDILDIFKAQTFGVRASTMHDMRGQLPNLQMTVAGDAEAVSLHLRVCRGKRQHRSWSSRSRLP